MNNKKMKKKILIASLVAIVGAVIFGSTILAEPGSENDPLVTLSYVENRIEEFRISVEERLDSILTVVNDHDKEIEDMKTKLENTNSENVQDISLAFNTELLKAGETLELKSGTEVIVRTGKTLAIEGQDGGLPDVTGGSNLSEGDLVPNNHLLIIPKDDGRGVYAERDSWVMIRGDYNIK